MGAEPVVVLYASISVLNWMRAATGSQCKDTRCPPGSLRSVQLPLDHLVEMRDRAVCHQHRNGRRSHVPV